MASGGEDAMEDDMALAILLSQGAGEAEECLQALEITREPGGGCNLPAALQWLADWKAQGGAAEGEEARAQRARGDRHKLVIVVRGDLGMSPGKVASQACHAALDAHRRAPDAVLGAWLEEGEPIIVLSCGDERHLVRLQGEAARAGLTNGTIRDAGRTEVDPGTTTVLYVGPARAVEIDAVTGELALLA